MANGPAKGRWFVTGDFPDLESFFVHEIRSIRAKDPFSPLLILVSSKLLGIHLRRLLAEEGVAHFNLRFWTLEEFAREISNPRLFSLGKRELPPHADELIIGEISKSLAQRGDGFYFYEISDRPGFHQAILSTIKDLKDGCLSPEEVEPFFQKGNLFRKAHVSKLQDLLKLWRGYQNELEKIGCYDESDLMIHASQWVNDSIFWRDTPKILLYGFYDFNVAQKRLLQACFEGKEAMVFLPFEPTPSFEFVKPALQWLKDTGFQEIFSEKPFSSTRSACLDHLCRHLFDGEEPFVGPAEAVEIISAPGEPREVQEVIRRALQASKKEGISFYQIGILLRNPEAYSKLFREVFHSLGIEPYLREGLPLIETRAGRSLMLLLNTMVQNFSRPSVMEFATFSNLRKDLLSTEEGLDLHVMRWDAISIRAGVVEGEKEWEERLKRLQANWSRMKDSEDDEEGRRRDFAKEDLIALNRLIRFTRKLFNSFQQLKEATTWGDKVTTLLNAFDDFVEQDEESLLVQKSIKSLSELDQLGISPGMGELMRLVNKILQEEIIPDGRFERNRPAVTNLMAARGVPFKMVILPGLVEKSFPPMIRQDAILLDQERMALNLFLGGKKTEPLPLKVEGRLNEERLLFRLAIGVATGRLILSYPRMEIGTGKERLPSSFLLASVKALTGRNLDFNQIETYPKFFRIPLSEIAVDSPEEAIDEVEYDLALGQQKLKEKCPDGILFLREVSPFFERGLRLEFSRWGERKFTGYDGIFNSEEALQVLRERYSIFKKSISPTRLEAYATCPYHYLLNVIMEVEALTEPEKEVKISPLDKGKLIHDILYEFYSELKKERGMSFKLKQEDLERLLETARKKFIEFEQIGITGFSVMWEMEKKGMLDSLKDFFNEELEETEFIPAYFEVRYGMKPYDFKESEISTEEPVLLPIGMKALHLKGKIDRIDLNKDRKRGRVRDYKTGKVSARKNEFQGGRTLQLPLYLHAARQLLGRIHQGIEIESAEYYSLIDGKSIPFEGAKLDEKEGELQEILETLASGIEDGIFLPVPDNQDCKRRYCDFRTICGSWARILFNRKSGDPKVRRFLKVTREESEEIEE